MRTEKEYSPEIYHSVTPTARSSASGQKAAIRCFRLRLWTPDVAFPAYAYHRGVSCVLASSGVDARRPRQDTWPACVPGTMWGTAPMLNLQVARGAVLSPELCQGLAAPSSRFALRLIATQPGSTQLLDSLSQSAGDHAPLAHDLGGNCAVYARIRRAGDTPASIW